MTLSSQIHLQDQKKEQPKIQSQEKREAARNQVTEEKEQPKTQSQKKREVAQNPITEEKRTAQNTVTGEKRNRKTASNPFFRRKEFHAKKSSETGKHTGAG